MKTGVSYFGNRILRHVKEDMEDIVKHHCDFVVHTFSEGDVQFYKSSMKEIVKISHDLGLEVWLDPWAVGGVFGGEAYSNFVATHLAARQVNSHGEFLPLACFNNGEFINFMRSWSEAALEAGGDVLFWDEPHFCIYPGEAEILKEPELWACTCQSCRRLFKKKKGYEMPSVLTKEVRDFRQESIVDFLRGLCDFIRHQGKQNALCVLPFEEPCGGIFDWSMVAKIESVDIIGTDPYWEREATTVDVKTKVRRFSKKIYTLAQAYKREGQIWIKNFDIKKGTENHIEVAIATTYEEGIRNIAAWSYYGGGAMSSLASDDPEGVWETLGKAYKRVK